MRGKVKYVTRSKMYRGADPWDIRITNTYAVLYNGDKVCIDEDEIRECYDYERITSNLIDELSNDLHNVWIEYSEDDDDGFYWLDDDLDDLV